MTLIVPLSFLVGALAGAFAAWRLRGRAHPDAPPRRRPRLKLAAATVLATVLCLSVVGFVWIRRQFQGGPAAPASMSQAVKDFRRAHRGARAQATPSDLPRPGVYTYRGQGFFRMTSDLFGNREMKLPATIPAIVVLDGRCFELTVRQYETRQWTERFCRDPQAGLRMQWRKNRSEMNGVKSRSKSECTPNTLYGPTGKPGATWAVVCKVVSHETTSSFKFPRPDLKVSMTHVGTREITIGGQKVRAHYLRQISEMSGPMKGRMVREVWYAVDTGLMLRMRVKGQGAGLATVKVDQTYTLASLSPKR